MDDIMLTVSRVIKQPLSRVWHAWADLSERKQWFCPEGMGLVAAEGDAVVGGVFKKGMRDPKTGATFVVAGVFREVVPERKLVFSWKWENGPGGASQSQVTVLFRAVGKTATELTINHEFFQTREERTEHNKGWVATLNNLEKYLK